MKVYVVMFVGVDESNVEAVYATEGLAEAHIAALEKSWQKYHDVYDYEVLNEIQTHGEKK